MLRFRYRLKKARKNKCVRRQRLRNRSFYID
ncbi:NAD-dependent protein deacylase, partial [Providencia rettgeri]|nr:NAD-dependent protein deacylase [Providencia rettgeri]